MSQNGITRWPPELPVPAVRDSEIQETVEEAVHSQSAMFTETEML